MVFCSRRAAARAKQWQPSSRWSRSCSNSCCPASQDRAPGDGVCRPGRKTADRAAAFARRPAAENYPPPAPPDLAHRRDAAARGLVQPLAAHREELLPAVVAQRGAAPSSASVRSRWHRPAPRPCRPGSRWAPPRGSTTTVSKTPSFNRSSAVSRNASAASFAFSALRQRIEAQPSARSPNRPRARASEPGPRRRARWRRPSRPRRSPRRPPARGSPGRPRSTARSPRPGRAPRHRRPDRRRACRPMSPPASGSGRAAHRASFRIVVLGNHRLIALIGLPVNVTLVMIPNQYLPVLATALHLSTDPLLPALKSDYGLAAPIRVRSRVDRILSTLNTA